MNRHLQKIERHGSNFKMGANYLLQSLAAQKWFAEEIARLKAAGHTVIGDTVIINLPKGKPDGQG